MHKSKNVAPYIKAQHLNQALNECLPKIIQIFDCTVNKLVLKMDRDAAERSAEKFRAQQSNNNNNNDMCNGKDYGKRPKLEPGEDKAEEEDVTRMRLAHLIVDLLNNIEAGSRTNVLRTPLVLKLAVLSVKYFFVGLTEQSKDHFIGLNLYLVINLLCYSCDPSSGGFSSVIRPAAASVFREEDCENSLPTRAGGGRPLLSRPSAWPAGRVRTGRAANPRARVAHPSESAHQLWRKLKSIRAAFRDYRTWSATRAAHQRAKLRCGKAGAVS